MRSVAALKEPFAFIPSLGLTRSVAAKLVCHLAAKLPDEELKVIADCVWACLVIKVVVEQNLTSEGKLDTLSRSIRAKFIVAESTRPDCIQLYKTLLKNFQLQGVSYATGLKTFLDTFNAGSSVECARLSELEARMLVLLPAQEQEFVSAVECHWDQFKQKDSALTLKILTSYVGRTVTHPPNTPTLWQTILLALPSKNLLFVKRLITIFLKNLKAAMAASKKPINLSFRSASWPNLQIS